MGTPKNSGEREAVKAIKYLRENPLFFGLALIVSCSAVFWMMGSEWFASRHERTEKLAVDSPAPPVAALRPSPQSLFLDAERALTLANERIPSLESGNQLEHLAYQLEMLAERAAQQEGYADFGSAIYARVSPDDYPHLQNLIEQVEQLVTAPE